MLQFDRDSIFMRTYSNRSCNILIPACYSYGLSDVEVAVEINRLRLHVSFLFSGTCLHVILLQVVLDIDYYKNRMQILALRPAPIQVDLSKCRCYSASVIPDSILRSIFSRTLEPVEQRRPLSPLNLLKFNFKCAKWLYICVYHCTQRQVR
jgi:hypothetical protein